MVQKSECPTEQLSLLMENQLPLAESSQVISHLEGCDCCQNALAANLAEDRWWDRARRGLAGAELDEGGYLCEGELSSPHFETLMISGDSRGDGQQLEDVSSAHLPEHIDEYLIEEKVGQGGMGVVYRGFDPSLNRSVAIKVLAPHLGANEVALRRFSREARAAAVVVHSNVVPIYRVSAAPDKPYIVMGFVDGCSLQEYVTQHGALAPEEVVRISLQIAQGLAAAHQQGLIHRDIKPANVLLDRDRMRVMISDFGLARAVDDVAMTQSGCLAGTPNYMSPEQVVGEEIDHRSDLFATGSLMYFLATGVEPFRAESAFAVIKRVMFDDPPSAIRIRPEIPQPLSRIIDRLLRKRPGDRIPSAEELERILTRLLAHLEAPDQVSAPVVKPNRSRIRRSIQRNAWWILLLTSLGVCGWSVANLVTSSANDREHGRPTETNSEHGHSRDHH